MRNYRAVVIDGKKIIRRGFLTLLFLTVAGLVGVILNLSDTEIPSDFFSAEKTLAESLPVMKGFSDDSGVMSGLIQGCRSILKFVLSFDVTAPETVIGSEVPVISSIGKSYLAKAAMENTEKSKNSESAEAAKKEDTSEETPSELYPIKEVDSGQTRALGGDSEKILIRNETDFSININQMLDEQLKFNMGGEGPKILIVHTHATESYSPEGATAYDAGESDRSSDKEQNMVKIGRAMKEVFEAKGIEVLHDETFHDQPNFNGSYENSRKTVEKYLAEYPGIQIVLDVHRDAFVYDDGTKAKFVTEIDGKKAAQLMLVVGTNAGGLEHPDWRENMKLALKFQKSILSKFPTLMRSVNLRKERFNGHTSYGSMIIEVGSSGNTVGEALLGAKYGAEAIVDFLNTLE